MQSLLRTTESAYGRVISSAHYGQLEPQALADTLTFLRRITSVAIASVVQACADIKVGSRLEDGNTASGTEDSPRIPGRKPRSSRF